MIDSVLNLPDDTRMLDVVRDGLGSADDVRIAVSFTRCSGLGLLIDPLKELVDRGGSARILTSTYQSITQPAALETLLGLQGVQTRVQSGPVGFHAKFWWFGRESAGECWAGSSNLSKGGLDTNLEWNLRSIDSATLAATRKQFAGLWERPDVHALSPELIRRYEDVYLAASVVGRAPAFGFAADDVGPVAPNAAQVEALAQLSKLRLRGERRGAVIAATGVGKTFLAAFDVLQHGARQVLYVSHRLEHLTQALRAFRRVLGDTRSLGLVGGGSDEQDKDIVFVTVASLANRPELAARAFEYLIIDEFHHVEAPSYEVLRPIRDRAFLLGITATPERQDGHDVLEWCDWNVAYEVRLPQAIDKGWLLPFHYFGIADETVDFLQIPWRRLEEVESALSVEARVDLVLQHALERGYDGHRRATVGFCAGRKHAHYMADAFNRRGQTAVAVLGDTGVARREELYARLADPDDPLEWVFVSDVMNEGVDIPAINSVLFLRPTESATLFLQQLGRGLRLCPSTEVLTVLDFVGHHRSAWLTLDALDAPEAGGRREWITDDYSIKPPKSCEVVLQRRTREILAKVKRFKSKKAECSDAYRRMRDGLGRPVRPVDLWNRKDVPGFSEFKQVYKTWLRCQEDNEDVPSWARGLSEAHVVRDFLRAVEKDWQQPRVWAYALLWGLCASPADPAGGYVAFFERWPQWRAEQAPLRDKAWSTLQRQLGGSLEGRQLASGIRDAMGDTLLHEVEGRLLHTLASEHQKRHGGVLRTPADLERFAVYERPEIIRHFGVQFDPAKHNIGMVWFDDHGVIITKLDTSGAVKRHQYKNRFLSRDRFSWTSQNQMSTTNDAGRMATEHAAYGRTLHLFVQPRSHKPALYVGPVRVVDAVDTAKQASGGPMRVELELSVAVPDAVLTELGVELSP